jgi:hypothetical protein
MIVINKDYQAVDKIMPSTYTDLIMEELVPAVFYLQDGEPVYPVTINGINVTLNVRSNYAYSAKESVIEEYIKAHPLTTAFLFDCRLDKVIYDITEAKLLNVVDWSYYIPTDKNHAPNERVVIGANKKMYKLYGSTVAPVFIFLGFMLQKLVAPMELQDDGLRFVCNFISRYYGKQFLSTYQLKDSFPKLFVNPRREAPTYVDATPWRDFDKLTTKITEKNSIVKTDSVQLERDEEDDEDVEDGDDEGKVMNLLPGGKPAINPFAHLIEPKNSSTPLQRVISSGDTVSIMELVGQEMTSELEFFRVIIPDSFCSKLYDGYIMEGMLYLTVKSGEVLTQEEENMIEESLQIKGNAIVYVEDGGTGGD